MKRLRTAIEIKISAIIWVGLLLALVLFGAPETWAAEATVEGVGKLRLGWEAPTQNVDGSDLTDLAGYKYYWGPQSRMYIDSFAITDETITDGEFQVTVTALVTEYYVAMTALDTAGNESAYSNEVLKTITLSVNDNMPPDAPILITVDFIFGGCVVTNDPVATCTITDEPVE